jgi:hypothetical protein
MKGYQPESFVAGYEPYIMFAYTHPQMMAVHKLMLGPEVRHDHNTLLYRKEGFPGQNWHSHAHHEGAARAEGPAAEGEVWRSSQPASQLVFMVHHENFHENDTLNLVS